jgi:hypothetical protein
MSEAKADDDRRTAEISQWIASIDRSQRGVDVELATLVLKAALPTRIWRGLKRHKHLVVVLEAPSRQWLQVLEKAANRAFEPVVICTYDGGSKSHRPDADLDRVSRKVQSFAVIGISHAPKQFMPQTMIAAADIYCKVGLPTADMIRDVMRLFAKRPVPRRLPDDIIAGLDFYDIYGAFRPDLSGVQVAAKLCGMRQGKRENGQAPDAPPLSMLHGYGGAKRWGLDLADRLKAWQRGEIAWSSISASAILAGPPGTGKTLFARSLARTCGVPLIDTSVGAWFAKSGGHLGDVIRASQEAFDRALAAKPCVLLLDEIDAVPDRATLDARSREWWTPVITHLLTLLDGATTDRTGVVVIGATNHGHMLDAALIRPGRLEQVIEVGLPSAADLVQIMRLKAGGALDAVSDDELLALTEGTRGATGAAAASWVRAACDRARDAARELRVEDLFQVMFPQDGRAEADIELASVHEAGHAIVYRVLGWTVRRVSIISVGDKGGYTEVVNSLGGAPDRAALEQLVVGALAGRAAEEVILGRVSSGSSGDLLEATRLVASLHASFGMGDTLVSAIEPDQASTVLRLDPGLRLKVDRDLWRLYEQATAIVKANIDVVREVAAVLRAERWLTQTSIDALTGAVVRGEGVAGLGELRTSGGDGRSPRDAPSE